MLSDVCDDEIRQADVALSPAAVTVCSHEQLFAQALRQRLSHSMMVGISNQTCACREHLLSRVCVLMCCLSVCSDAAHSLLRPETVESLFIMFRLTGDKKYQNWGSVAMLCVAVRSHLWCILFMLSP